MALEIPGGEIDEWLAPLKPFQRNALSEFLKSGSPEDAAARWLTTMGSPNIIAFGGGYGDSRPFWDLLRAEFKKFICDDSAYVEEKRALGGESAIAKSVWIAVISAALGATLGFVATLLAPAIAVLLSIVVKVGTNAYCQAVP